MRQIDRDILMLSEAGRAALDEIDRAVETVLCIRHEARKVGAHHYDELTLMEVIAKSPPDLNSIRRALGLDP